jgi:hypothetical protein
MKQPEGFEVKDSSWMAKLQKGLYDKIRLSERSR